MLSIRLRETHTLHIAEEPADPAPGRVSPMDRLEGQPLGAPAGPPRSISSVDRLEVLEQPEAVGRVGLGPALDREEVEAGRRLLALLKELSRRIREAAAA